MQSALQLRTLLVVQSGEVQSADSTPRQPTAQLGGKRPTRKSVRSMRPAGAAGMGNGLGYLSRPPRDAVAGDRAPYGERRKDARRDRPNRAPAAARDRPHPPKPENRIQRRASVLRSTH